MSSVGVDPEFWNGRRVFLTGHTGFIGSWLGLWLARMGAVVTGYALAPPTEPSHYDAIALDRDLQSLHGDIRDADALTRAVAASRPEIILHLAAQPLVRHAHAAPAETFETNVMGVVNLLDAARRVDDLQGVIVFTTDKVYENQEWPWGYRENDRLGGREPYGASKACAEIVTAAFRRSYFADGTHGTRGAGIATVRAGNVIGGGDWAGDRLVPDAVRAFAAGDVLALRNPDAIRPWQHVLEPAAGCLLLAERLAEDPARFSSAWNLGPDEGGTRPVSWVVAELARRWGQPTKVTEGNHTGPYEALLLSLSNVKARNQLGWRPMMSLEDALAMTVAWYSLHLAGGDVRALSIEQVESAMGKQSTPAVTSLSAGGMA